MHDATSPQLIIVMGVSGCGKSTVANALAQHLRYEFIEADDFHSPQNREHMASGQALTDAMREPWVNALREHLTELAKSDQNCVMSFSGLKAAHRARIREVPMQILTLHLEGPRELIQARMNQRANHFMPSSLLDSQFQSLENPNHEANTLSIDIDCTLEQLITKATTAARKH